MHPGTPAYRSPESWCREFNRDRSLQHRAQAAEDLFALGVTACRLVTGQYPQLASPRRDERGLWHVDSVTAPSALSRDKRIDPTLRAWIVRLLSVRPEERGSAAQLAEALEQHSARPLADSPAPRSPRAHRVTAPPTKPTAASPVPARSTRSEKASLALAVATLALAGGAWWVGTGRAGVPRSLTHAEPAPLGTAEAGTEGLGHAAMSTSTVASPALQQPKGMTEDTLPTPLPEQVRPDSKGRCPHKQQVALNGGCWVEIPLDRETCETALSGYKSRMFKNKCYMPILQNERQPNSSPTTTP